MRRLSVLIRAAVDDAMTLGGIPNGGVDVPDRGSSRDSERDVVERERMGDVLSIDIREVDMDPATDEVADGCCIAEGMLMLPELVLWVDLRFPPATPAKTVFTPPINALPPAPTPLGA